MRYAVIALASFVALSGCVTVSKTYGPDGKEAFSLNCRWAWDWGQCVEKAGELCGTKGYEVVRQYGEVARLIKCKE
jgi:hypothetical protein